MSKAKAKRGYDKGYYTKEMLLCLVGLPTGITAEDYKEITGEDVPDETKDVE